MSWEWGTYLKPRSMKYEDSMVSMAWFKGTSDRKPFLFRSNLVVSCKFSLNTNFWRIAIAWIFQFRANEKNRSKDDPERSAELSPHVISCDPMQYSIPPNQGYRIEQTQYIPILPSGKHSENMENHHF